MPNGYIVVVRRFMNVIPDTSKNVRSVCDISTKYRAQNNEDITVSPTHHRRYVNPDTLRALPIANSPHLVIAKVTNRMDSNIVALKLNVTFSMLRKSSMAYGL